MPDINSESTLPSNNPAPFDIVPVYENAKSSLLSEQVSADIDPEILNPKLFRSRYAKFIVIGVKYNRHVARRDREPSRIPAKKLSRLLNKRRKLRKRIRKHIKRNVPRSSHISIVCFMHLDMNGKSY